MRRYEFKYLVRLELAERLAELLAVHFELDPHCGGEGERSYTVRNIYFDSPHFTCFHDKLAGKLYREKFRIRTYNGPYSAPLFLEHKVKNGLSYLKDKIPLGGTSLRTFHDLKACLSDTVGRGNRLLEQFFLHVSRHAYSPVVLVTYDREAYVHPCDETIRITLDKNLRARMFPELAQIYTEEGMSSLLPGWAVLEVKFTHVIPRWIKRFITVFRLHRSTFSKYCTCVGHFLGEAPEREGKAYVLAA